MAKNIVLCADGTGNKGGYTPDSNVYRMYHAVDLHDVNNPQVTFYDNGVGTQTNKFVRALSGAVGIGFSQNIKDLYRFLIRHYEPGDKVYLFGFSRGAATIRAFSGFIATCGLMKGSELSARELDERVELAFDAYRKRRQSMALAEQVKASDESHGVIDIEFLGVWDTVSALGFPKRTDITGVTLWALDLMFRGLDWLFGRYFAYLFYNYELTDNVCFACQALALDDARTAFWPWVWDERGRAPGSVEQVWFAGMHSNVGGGYARAGMSYVTLEWMMARAQRHGLRLLDDKVREAHDNANVHGRMYDSRDGFAMYYRYHPRVLKRLTCAGGECLRGVCRHRQPGGCSKLLEDIKVHDSVIDRMCQRTANYAPTQLPDKFAIVETDLTAPAVTIEPAKDSRWQKAREMAEFWILMRKRLYGVLLDITLLVAGFAVYFWLNPQHPVAATGFMRDVAGVLNDVLPDFFNGLIAVVMSRYPEIFWAVMAYVVMYFLLRQFAKQKTIVAGEQLRRVVMTVVEPYYQKIGKRCRPSHRDI